MVVFFFYSFKQSIFVFSSCPSQFYCSRYFTYAVNSFHLRFVILIATDLTYYSFAWPTGRVGLFVTAPSLSFR